MLYMGEDGGQRAIRLEPKSPKSLGYMHGLLMLTSQLSSDRTPGNQRIKSKYTRAGSRSISSPTGRTTTAV